MTSSLVHHVGSPAPFDKTARRSAAIPELIQKANGRAAIFLTQKRLPRPVQRPYVSTVPPWPCPSATPRNRTQEDSPQRDPSRPQGQNGRLRRMGYARRIPCPGGGLIAEHLAVRNAVGLFDVSHMGEIQFRGPGSLAAVQHITMNDASRLEDGQAHYSALLTPQGNSSTTSRPPPQRQRLPARGQRRHHGQRLRLDQAAGRRLARHSSRQLLVLLLATRSARPALSPNPRKSSPRPTSRPSRTTGSPREP